MTRQRDHQKAFIDLFKKLTYTKHSWQAWSDFVLMAACAISNPIDLKQRDDREQKYLDTIKRYDPKEQQVIPELFAVMVNALDEEPEQDFLGSLFQELELSSHWHGQFFTPYHVCKTMAQLQMSDLDEQIKEQGYVTVNDPTCGAGATLIGFANVAKEMGVNFQDHVLFVAQDIDSTAAMMCYIQLSLLGCAGYVIVGDTLARPGLHPDNSVWYMPMYFSDVWHWRRKIQAMNKILEQLPDKPKTKMDPPKVVIRPVAKTKELEQLTLF